MADDVVEEIAPKIAQTNDVNQIRAIIEERAARSASTQRIPTVTRTTDEALPTVSRTADDVAPTMARTTDEALPTVTRTADEVAPTTTKALDDATQQLARTSDDLARTASEMKQAGKTFEEFVRSQQEKISDFLDWRIRGYSIVPSRPGAKFSVSEIENIRKQIEKTVDTVWFTKETPTSIKVGGLDTAARNMITEGYYTKATLKEEWRKVFDNALVQEKSDAINSLPAAKKIDDIFGNESMNVYNKQKLIDFIDGKTGSFEGMPNVTWETGLRKLGAIDDRGAILWEKVKEGIRTWNNAPTTRAPQPPSPRPAVKKEAPTLMQSTTPQAIVSDDLIERGIARANDINGTRPINEGTAVPTERATKFSQTVADSKRATKEVREAAYSGYTPTPNAQSIEDAAQILAKGDSYAIDFIETSEPTSTSFALGQLLIEKFQRLGTDAGVLQAVKIVETLAQKAKTSGQAIQALSLWGRTNPAGILKYAERELGKHGMKLDDVLAKKLMDDATEIAKMPEGYDKQFATAVMLKQISDKLPVSNWRKMSLVQTMMMLLNPKTIARNIIGNGGFLALENVSKSVAALLDVPFAILTGKHVTALPSVRAQWKGAGAGWEQGVKEALAGVNTMSVKTQFDLPQTPTFKGGVGKALETTLSVVLRAPDRAFFNASYQDSVYRQLKAYNKTTGKTLMEPTDEMVEIAIYDGLYATFQDESLLANSLMRLKRGMNLLSTAGTTSDFGMGDIILKFPYTPANLLNRGAAYTPLGFLRSVMLASAPLMGKKFNRLRFLESFSRALVGSGSLFATGMMLNELGILSGPSEKDAKYDVANAKKQMGIRDYQINVSALKRFMLSGFDAEQAKLQEGDKLVSYDWLQPMVVPVAMGASMNDGSENKGSVVWAALSAASDSADMLVEQPMLRGIKQYFQDVGYYGAVGAGLRQLANLPASFVPTLMNQITQLVDNTSRNTEDESLAVMALNKVKARVPGFSDDLPAVVGTFGFTQEKYQDGTNNAFNVLINPMFVQKYKSDPAINLSLSLYNKSLDASVVPDNKRLTQKVNGKDVRIGPKTYEKFQRFTGTRARVYLTALSSDPNFIALSDEEKERTVVQLLRDVHAAAKIVVLGDRPENPSERVRQLLQNEKSNTQDSAK